MKSSSRWQTWGQKLPSQVQFGIRPTREWSAETNELATVARRQADVYVFALLEAAEKSSLDPLDLRQWRFHVVSTALLNERFPTQKMLSLKALEGLGFAAVGFEGLAGEIEARGQAAPRSQKQSSTW